MSIKFIEEYSKISQPFIIKFKSKSNFPIVDSRTLKYLDINRLISKLKEKDIFVDLNKSKMSSKSPILDATVKYWARKKEEIRSSECEIKEFSLENKLDNPSSLFAYNLKGKDNLSEASNLEILLIEGWDKFRDLNGDMVQSSPFRPTNSTIITTQGGIYVSLKYGVELVNETEEKFNERGIEIKKILYREIFPCVYGKGFAIMQGKHNEEEIKEEIERVRPTAEEWISKNIFGRWINKEYQKKDKLIYQ
jgi:hypothetical protein